jgi:hypothetical protein
MSKKGRRQRIVADTDEKYFGNANPERSLAMHMRNASSAASPFEDQRTKRARSRKAAKIKAIQDHGHN